VSVVTDKGAEIQKKYKKMPKISNFFSHPQRFEEYTILNISDTLNYFSFLITYFTPVQRHFGCMSTEIWTWSHPSRPSAEFKISARRSQVTRPARLNELVQYLLLYRNRWVLAGLVRDDGGRINGSSHSYARDFLLRHESLANLKEKPSIGYKGMYRMRVQLLEVHSESCNDIITPFGNLRLIRELLPYEGEEQKPQSV